MIVEPEARRRFRRYAQGPDDALDLVEAALWLGAEDDADADLDAARRALADLAGGAAAALVGVEGSRRRAEALNGHLVRRGGFRGDREAYDHPRNSWLHSVIERRRGLPITLSVVWLEIGRRAGVPLVGVGAPGHFLLRHRDDADVFVDAFHGHVLDREGVRALFRALAEEPVELTEAQLAPVGARAVLLRMLHNLRTAWERRGEGLKMVAACDRLLLLDPNQLGVYVARAVAYASFGAEAFAAADLEAYLARAPADAPQRPALRELLDRIRQRVGGQAPS